MKKIKHNISRNRRGSIVLESGETITKKEQAAFKSAVNASNQARKRAIQDLEGRGEQIYRDFGKTSDTIMQKRSAAFSQFENKQQFKNALERARQTIPLAENRARIYKQNTIKALKTAYGDTADTRKIANAITKMSHKKFNKLVDSGELEGVEFVYYDPENEKLKKLANQLGVSIGSDMPLPTAKNRRK